MAEAIAAHERGDREMIPYDSKAALYADLDLPASGELGRPFGGTLGGVP
ncbi:hypothetical protein ABT120_49360 [Nonomuraea angiospora]